jgi:Type I phosphodiesterase / nucleotide pyrophosphatase
VIKRQHAIHIDMRPFPMSSPRIMVAALILVLPTLAGRAAEPSESVAAVKTKTRNILLVTTDGLRWQEVFGGADAALMNKKAGGVENVDLLTEEFGGETPEVRRKALLPFLWNVMAKNGQLYGNANAGSEAKVTNGRNFSYPGYNEIFTGWADPSIDSNDKKQNGNVTVLEWLNGQEDFHRRIAAFGSWDRFPFILNSTRSRIRVVAGWRPLVGRGLSSEERLLSRLIVETPRIWDDCAYDTFTFHAALEYFKRQRPRVLYIGLGETDEFGHAGRYDHYLHAAHRVDSYLRILWETVQSLPDYRGATTLILSTDHGRGEAPVEWKGHGAKVKGSERIWMGFLGPDTPPLGERTGIAPVTQSQIAATLATFLGLDYRASAPKAAPPIADALRR